MWKHFALAAALAVSSLALRADDQSAVAWMDPRQLWEHKNSEQVRTELGRRNEYLEAEIGTGAVPEWAGEYYTGDGLGKNIAVMIAPQGGFTYTWHGCLGLYDVNYGTVDSRGRRLTLSLELPNGKDFGVPDHFLPVRWGERHYLLADDELKSFVNAVNSGHEPCGPRCGPFLLRKGDDEKPVHGRPDLPEDLRKLLLDQPIAGRVVAVLDTETRFDHDSEFGWRTTKVEIDIGRDDGVWEGMELYSQPGNYVGSGYEIVRADAHKSSAVMHDMVEKGEPGLEPGLCVSTRPEQQTCPVGQTAALR